MTSREQILQRLKHAPRPYADFAPVENRHDMVPTDQADLYRLFVEQAQKLNCSVHECRSTDEALQRILAIIGEDKTVLSWDALPLPGLAEALHQAGIQTAPANDPHVRVGITGVDAALAGTGSLVLASKPGQSRLVSLLPFVHVAVVKSDQILPNFEAWAEQTKRAGLDQFRATSNVLVISGPSRTADIAMELVLGAHGPAELHILILP